MALYHLKRIEGPVPGLSSGYTGWQCTIIDRNDPTFLAVKHVDVADVSTTKKCDILAVLDTTYTPNDFAYLAECPES